MRISDWSSDVCSSDLLELLGMLRQRLLQVLFPEETCIGQTRRQHLAVARDDLHAAVDRVDVRGANEAVGELAVRVIHDEIFLVARKSVVEGKSVSVRVDFGGRRIMKKKKKKTKK